MQYDISFSVEKFLRPNHFCFDVREYKLYLNLLPLHGLVLNYNFISFSIFKKLQWFRGIFETSFSRFAEQTNIKTHITPLYR